MGTQKEEDDAESDEIYEMGLLRIVQPAEDGGKAPFSKGRSNRVQKRKDFEPHIQELEFITFNYREEVVYWTQSIFNQFSNEEQ